MKKLFEPQTRFKEGEPLLHTSLHDAGMDIECNAHNASRARTQAKHNKDSGRNHSRNQAPCNETSNHTTR